MEDLYEKLRKYCGSDYYPFHMPGHKRRLGMGMGDPLGYDITEIEGFDNLHHPEGILLEAQRRAARLYGAEETHFLVNGSTAGILCAIGACAPSGRILMARNSHRAAYHALSLNRLEAVWLYPGKFVPEGEAEAWEELNGPILAADAEAALEACPDVRAVFITSPTYDGVCSDVAAIARASHRRGLPLIVDGAHGAHFGMHSLFPENAVRQGADLVIHSLHKTLPAPTQTALLHVQGDRVDRRRLRRLLAVYQTSSPSYVLMAGIDRCVGLLEREKDRLFGELAGHLDWFRRETGNLELLRLPKSDDPSKILISAERAGLTGLEIQKFLREEAHLELEMAAGSYALALASVGDDREGFVRLAAALGQLEERLKREKREGRSRKQQSGKFAGYFKNQTAMSISRAEESPQQQVLLEESLGLISGEYIFRYPPGVPLAVPGERIGSQLLEQILRERDLGYDIQGPEDPGMRRLWTVKEERRLL